MLEPGTIRELTQTQLDQLGDGARADLLMWLWQLERRGWPWECLGDFSDLPRVSWVRWREGERRPLLVRVYDTLGEPHEREDCPLELPESILLSA